MTSILSFVLAFVLGLLTFFFLILLRQTTILRREIGFQTKYFRLLHLLSFVFTLLFLGTSLMFLAFGIWPEILLIFSSALL